MALAGEGSIPAGTGKPRGPSLGGLITRVDPRGHGEAPFRPPYWRRSEGRSPRARGSHGGEGLASPSGGSIPAGTGKPPPASPPCRSCGVDPRGHGEATAGLPPLLPFGSIPAGTGKPPSGPPTGDGRKVDPRGHGEARGAGLELATASGRSPRARGSHPVGTLEGQGFGSIPAGTGKPLITSPECTNHRVDPRGHGEAKPCWVIASSWEGRSPRARGSQAVLEIKDVAAGSIPAGTGKPLPSQRIGVSERVDPRGHGEAAAC